MLVLTGIAAAVPAALLFPAPLRELLAFAVNDFEPAPGFAWAEIARLYPGTLLEALRSDAGFVRGGQWYTGLYFVAGLALLLVLARGRTDDRAVRLLRATVASGILYLLTVPLFSAFRLELVLVPAAAFGFGLAAERLEALARERLVPRLSGGAVAHELPGRHP